MLQSLWSGRGGRRRGRSDARRARWDRDPARERSVSNHRRDRPPCGPEEPEMNERWFGLTRRELLKAGSAAAIASQLPILAWRSARADLGCEPRPRFFTDAEDYRTLEALVDRLIPEDTDTNGAPSYGAKRAKVADYIDFLLGTFGSS